MRIYLIVAVIALSLLSCQNAEEKADLILKNGKIVTMDINLPEAEAVAVRGNRIIAVGSDEEMNRYAGPQTKEILLQGRTVIPGLIEGHAHFLSLGYAKMKLDLTNVKRWDEIVEMVKNKVKESQPGEWIYGRGWHQEKWQSTPKKMVEGYPVHDLLSKVSPDNPVKLVHASGHAVIINKNALDVSGINSETKDPAGGKIVCDDKGRPTGVLLENAEALVKNEDKHQPDEAIDNKRRQAAELSIRECIRYGITSFHDASSSFEDVDFYRQLIRENKLKLRLWVMLGESNDALREKGAQYRIIGEGPNLLTVRAIKRFMDGALGARGAWMLEPYSDLSSTNGLNTIDLNVFKETCDIALQHGFQVCTHAIGDQANRETLNIYEQAFGDNPKNRELRWRIEHAQHLHPDDIPRFSRLGVIASMQAIHCTSDGPWVPKRIGDKRAEEGAYVWLKLIDSEAVVSNGTDAPVESVNPFANFYAAVTRKMKNGELFYPKQVLNRRQALKAMTIDAAYTAFEEHEKGSITPGKLADLTILSQDIMTVPVENIPGTKVLMTILGGEAVYDTKEILIQ